MNKFELYLDGSEIKGVVFPFRFGERLDERLDEAYVDFHNSEVDAYKPLTEAKIVIYQDEDLKDTLYYIVSSDNSQEYPIGSGKYKHSLHLLERTKLLEGVMCSSLTFTTPLAKKVGYEALKNTYATHEFLCEGKSEDGEGYSERDKTTYTNKYIVSFAPENVEFNVPKYVAGVISNQGAFELSQIGTKLIDIYNNTNSNRVRYDFVYNYTLNRDDLTITSDVYANEEKITDVSLYNKFADKYNVVYRLVFAPNDPVYSCIVFKIKFEITNGFPRLPAKQRSITDCINRVLECAYPLFESETPKYKFEGVVYDTNGKISHYESDSQAEKYDKISAPDITLMAGTLREQLKTIGTIIQAEPWIDENNIVHFLEFGENYTLQISENDSVTSLAKTDITQYCSEVRTNAQNLVSTIVDEVVVEPGANQYRSLRSPDLYQRVTTENGVLLTDNPIYSIKKVMCGILERGANKHAVKWKEGFPVDITQYIREETQYALLSNFDEGVDSKSCALYYTMGSPNIKGLFYQAPSAINTATSSPFAICNILAKAASKSVNTMYKEMVDNDEYCSIAFCISYIPLRSAVLSHSKGKFDNKQRHFAQIYNQTEAIIEQTSFGNAMRGVAARLGNTEKEKTLYLKTLTDIPNVGNIKNGYVVSETNSELTPNFIKSTMTLSKDFNRISEHVGIPNIKRMYEISERQVCDRSILIKYDLIIGNKDSFSPNKESKWGKLKLDGFVAIFNKDNVPKKITNVLIKTSKENLGMISSGLTLPVASTIGGNAANFSFNFKDNYSAGVNLSYETGGEAIGFWSADIPYCDDNGEIYWLYFAFGNYSSTLLTMSDTLPNDYTSLSSSMQYNSGNFRIRKDNRENVKISYAVEAKAMDENIIIGPDFMKYCSYVHDDTLPGVKLYVLDWGRPINNLQSEIDENLPFRATEGEISFSSTDSEIFTVTSDIKNKGYGWVIATEPLSETRECVLDDGTVTKETITSPRKILIASRSTVVNEEIKLDFFMTREI